MLDAFDRYFLPSNPLTFFLKTQSRFYESSVMSPGDVVKLEHLSMAKHYCCQVNHILYSGNVL